MAQKNIRDELRAIFSMESRVAPAGMKITQSGSTYGSSAYFRVWG